MLSRTSVALYLLATAAIVGGAVVALCCLGE
jgi:hypothetical protein